MRPWTAPLAAGLLAAHSLLLLMTAPPQAQAQAAATCPVVSIKTHQAVVSNLHTLVAVKLSNPNPSQAWPWR